MQYAFVPPYSHKKLNKGQLIKKYTISVFYKSEYYRIEIENLLQLKLMVHCIVTLFIKIST